MPDEWRIRRIPAHDARTNVRECDAGTNAYGLREYLAYVAQCESRTWDTYRAPLALDEWRTRERMRDTERMRVAFRVNAERIARASREWRIRGRGMFGAMRRIERIAYARGYERTNMRTLAYAGTHARNGIGPNAERIRLASERLDRAFPLSALLAYSRDNRANVRIVSARTNAHGARIIESLSPHVFPLLAERG